MGLHSNRRRFLGGLGALIGSAWSALRLRAATAPPTLPQGDKISGFGSTGNVYEELGVTTVINGQGTMTTLGGSLVRPEVEAVMALGSKHFVSIPELERAAGERIVQMLKLPEGYSALVTSGAAAAMQSGLAGLLTGASERFIEQLPDLTGLKSEVIIQKAHRNPFDHQLRATGVKLVVIETREELHDAVGPQTAMMHFTNFANAAGQIKVEEWLKLAKQYNLATMIDAAADTPPVSHLWDYAQMGYDMITFSGGKAMRGPQCAGLLIGRKEMVGNALLNNSPFEDTLGRGQKVGKEEIVGMIKALEIYLKEDHDALTKEWWSRLDKISADVTKVPGVSTAYFVPGIANHVPHVQINWDPRRIALAPREAAGLLRKGTPSIVVESTETGLAMNSFMLQPGEDAVVGAKIAELLRAHPV
jgi:uncharacterized pyridoxal phosphate-dependent enzyme